MISWIFIWIHWWVPLWVWICLLQRHLYWGGCSTPLLGEAPVVRFFVLCLPMQHSSLWWCHPLPLPLTVLLLVDCMSIMFGGQGAYPWSIVAHQPICYCALFHYLLPSQMLPLLNPLYCTSRFGGGQGSFPWPVSPTESLRSLHVTMRAWGLLCKYILGRKLLRSSLIKCSSMLRTFVDNTERSLRYHCGDSVVVFQYYQHR